MNDEFPPASVDIDSEELSDYFKIENMVSLRNAFCFTAASIIYICCLCKSCILSNSYMNSFQKSTSEVDPGREFEPVKITGDRNDLMRLVPNIQRISTKMCNGNKTLGFVFPSDSDKWIMDNFALRYSNYKFAIHTERFATLEDMKEVLTSDLNFTSNKICGHYMGGVYISKIDTISKQFEYRIYVRDREGNDWQTDKFWPDDGPYGALADINSIPSKPNYWSTGYISFKYALDSIFLKQVGRNISDFDFHLARFPTPQFRNNGLLALLKSMPVLFIILTLAVMIHTTKEIVTEKESGIKTYLMVMGLNSTSFYASHFIIAFLKIVIVMGSSSLALSTGFLVSFVSRVIV